MHCQVQIVGSIHDARDATEQEEQQPGDKVREEPLIALATEVGELRPPREQSLTAALTRPMLQRRRHCERRDETRQRHHEGQERMPQLPACRQSALRVLVMQPHRHGKHQEQQQRQSRRRVRVELAAHQIGQNGVEHDIRWQQPEVDQRMPEEPEQCARQQRVDLLYPAQRKWQQLEQYLNRHRDDHDEPQDEGHEYAQHRQREPPGWVFTAPRNVVRNPVKEERHQRPHHQQHHTHIEGPVRNQGGIEGIQHIRLAREHRVSCHQRAAHHQQPRNPLHARLERPLEAEHHHRVAEGDNNKGREHNRVNRAVERETLIILNPQIARAFDDSRPLEHLQQPQQHAQNQQHEREHNLTQQNEP
ncbi:hypothetical protein HRbin14_02252 [bacterium HR14]|nr:hypothetical protein HRbin14_02252 [bacterium HR14]